MKKIIPTPYGTLVDTQSTKMFKSDDCNFIFDKSTGTMCTWGKTEDDDPVFAPFPFILDIEITTKCNGPNNKLCSFFYKSNNPNGYNMPFEHFKDIVDKMPFLTQMALGADAHGTTNPEMFKMMRYARESGIIPNLTIADVSEDVAKELADVAGAVAVSVYRHAGFDVGYDSIKRLSDAGLEQVNIHFMISSSTIKDAYKIIDDSKTDERLKGLNAIIFLGLKQKGRGSKFDYVSTEQYQQLVQYCLDNDVRFGFDSCSAPAFLRAVENHPQYEDFKIHTEDCESTLFSSYINEKGEFFPCSFTENWKEGSWDVGISVLDSNDFISDVWNHQKTVDFRNTLINNTDHNKCRNCPAFAVCSIDMRVYKEESDLFKIAL